MKIIICFLFLLFTLPANASLIGDEVGCTTSSSSWSCDPTTTSVSGSVVEFGIMLHAFRAFDLDIGESNIDFNVLLSVGGILGLGPVSILDIDSMITGFTFDTNIEGLDVTRLSFTDHSFNTDFDGLTVAPGQFLNINLVTASVPEPSTMSLLGLALAGIGFFRKKKSV